MNGRKRWRRLWAPLAIAALVAALALPGSASAQVDCANPGSDPTAAQYCPPTEIPPPTEVPSGGALPFTGLDVVSLLAVALALTGVGVGLRRLTADGGTRS
jgi:hypothetical protein